MITITCSSCGEKYNIADDMAGRRVKCRECDETIKVPRKEAYPLGDEDDDFDPPEPPEPPEPPRRRQPERPASAQNEPWYYGFLERYAWVALVIDAFVGFVWGGYEGTGGFRRQGDDFLIFFLFGAAAGAAVSAALTIYPVAFLLMQVDIGRNIRSLKQRDVATP